MYQNIKFLFLYIYIYIYIYINNEIKNYNAIKEVREIFNELRSNNLFREETKQIRKELYKKETVYNSLKEK